MSVTIIWRAKEYQVQAGQTVAEALLELNLDPELFLVVREGALIPADAILQDGDIIRLVAVMAGG